jgi:integrase
MKRRNLPPNVTIFIDRHGKERFRWRKTGFKPVMLKGYPGTAKKPSAEYLAISSGAAPQVVAPRTAPGTVSDLIARYYRSTGFTNAAASTQRTKRGIFEAFREEFGADRVDGFTFAHIEAILAAKAKRGTDSKGRAVGGPSAAHELGKQLKRLFRYAVKLELITSNPVDLADAVKVPKTGGIHTWTEAEIAQFQRRHPVGSKARLAMEIMLWTGQRRGDARLFGPSHIVTGRIFYEQGKTKKGLWLPVAPQLLAAIRAMPAVGLHTYLVTDFGKPFSAAGFGNWFRDQCDAAGLPQCSAHGLRKAIARRLAESGATQQGLKAVGGWSGDAEVALYTAEVDQQALADTTLGRLWKGEE